MSKIEFEVLLAKEQEYSLIQTLKRYKLERALEVAVNCIKNEMKEVGDYWAEGEDALKRIKAIMEDK